MANLISPPLKKGSKGRKVKKVQERLNTSVVSLSPLLVPDGDYGTKTYNAVKKFQKQNHLIEDGEIGNFTYAMLYFKPHLFMLSKPKKVKQTNWTCWAGALESMLTRLPTRKNYTIKELTAKYKKYVSSNGAINWAGIRQFSKDLRLHGLMPEGVKISNYMYVEKLRKLLMRGFPFLVMNFGGASAGHTRVLYGVRVKDGELYLHFMDPMKGYTMELLSDTRKYNQLYLLGAKEIKALI